MRNINVDSSKQIKLGALISYIAMAFNIVSGLIYTPWMVSEIGKSEFGLYTLAISIISFFAMDFGLGSAVSRFISKYKSENNEIAAKRFLGSIYKLFLVIAGALFLTFLIVYINIENIYSGLTLREIEKLKVLFLVSGTFSVISFPFNPFDGILIANERFIFIKTIELLQRVLTIILMVIALQLGYGLYALVVVNAFVGLVKVTIKYIYISTSTETEVDFKYSGKGLYSEIFSFSAWTTIIIVAQRFILNITPTILGAFAGSSEIALFSIGMTIEAYTYSISGALGGLFLPKVTRMIVQSGDMKNVEKLLIKVGRIQLFIVGLILTIFASMGKEFIVLWMGKSFSNSYYIALFLLLPAFITHTQEIANTSLVALNEIKYRAIASITTASISVVLSVILSPVYGAVGSSIAIFIGNIIGMVVVMNIIYHKVLKINILSFFKECHIKLIIPITLTYISGVIVQEMFPVNSLLLYVVKALILMLLYFILMWKITFNQFEKQIFIDVIYKITNRR